jgi:hypothetical protein
MAIQNPISDLARSKQHEPDRIWPHEVKIAVHWQDDKGRITVRSEVISANQFFGEGSFGAPLSGDHVISMIERMRREGPPKFKRNPNGRKRAE